MAGEDILTRRGRPMECQDIQAQLARGESPAGAEAEGHLTGCAPCRSLVEAGPRLVEALSFQPADEPTDAEALLGRLSRQLEEERGLAAWLRERPARQQGWSVLAAAALVCLGTLAGAPRVDLPVYPALQLALTLALLAGATLAAALLALRPLHRPAPGRAARWAVTAAGVLLPLALASLPQAHSLDPRSLAGAGADFLPRAAACFLFGVAVGLPALALVWLFERRRRRPLGQLLLAAALAGLTGDLALQLHCPITQPLHLLASHGSIGLALAGLIALGALALRRR